MFEDHGSASAECVERVRQPSKQSEPHPEDAQRVVTTKLCEPFRFWQVGREMRTEHPKAQDANATSITRITLTEQYVSPWGRHQPSVSTPRAGWEPGMRRASHRITINQPPDSTRSGCASVLSTCVFRSRSESSEKSSRKYLSVSAIQKVSILSSLADASSSTLR